MPTRVLLIEDEVETAQRYASALAIYGYQVSQHHGMAGVAERLRSEQPDVMILDRMIHGEDALGSVAGWKAAVPIPVLVLTSLANVRERIRGLDSGADDYLVKPANPGEIDARIRALLRRGPASSGDMLINGELRIDRIRREARVGQRMIHLQPREFRLLEELALRQDEVVHRSVLLKSVWDLNFEPRTKLIEVHVSRLRQKLRDAGSVDLIDTVRGTGYRLNSWAADA